VPIGHRRHLRVICSCDRYNYGDLLFPLISRQGLAAIGDDYEIAEYGLVPSDLSAFGARPSRGMKDLYRDVEAGDVVLLAGGENLAQTWFAMHLSLLDQDGAGQHVRLSERFGSSLAEWLSRRKMGGGQPFPYILGPDQFREPVRVMYNSMGGWPLRHFQPHKQKAITDSLQNASFVSVRDRESAAILHEIDPTLKVRLAPDCVFLLPELFPRDHLAEMASPAVRELVRKTGDFICFQCNSPYGDANREEIKRQLAILAARSGMRIVLAPTARIWPFEDHVFLTALAGELGNSAKVLPASATIYDVAYTLASGRLFCGTSLHGVITALAHNVPFVPLATSDPKLGNNIESWGLQDSFPMAAVADLAEQGFRALNLDRAWISDQAEGLRSAARDNMRQLEQAILAG